MEDLKGAGCNGVCQGCEMECPSADGEKKINFFDKMEEIATKVSEIGEENILKIINETVAEWEKEEEEEEEG